MPYPDELIETYRKIVKPGQTVHGLLTEEQLISRAMNPKFRAFREKSKADFIQEEKRKKEATDAHQIIGLKNNTNLNEFERFKMCLMDISNNPSAKEHNEMSMDMLNCDEGFNSMMSKIYSSLLNLDLSMAFPDDDFQALDFADRNMAEGVITYNAEKLLKLTDNPVLKAWMEDNKVLLECCNLSNSTQKYYASDTSLFLKKNIPNPEENILKIYAAVNPEYSGLLNRVNDFSAPLNLDERNKIKELINKGRIDKNDLLFTKAYRKGANGEKEPLKKFDAIKDMANGDNSVVFEPMTSKERQKIIEAMKNPMNLKKKQLDIKKTDFKKYAKDIYKKLLKCEGKHQKNEPEFDEIKKLVQDYMKIKKPTAEQSYKFFRNVQPKAKQYVKNRAEKVNDMNPTMKKYYDTINNLVDSLTNGVGLASAVHYQEKFGTKFVDKAMTQREAKKKVESISAKQRKDNQLHDKYMSFSEKVVSGKMPHCSNKNFQNLVFIGTSSTLSPVFQKGETQKEGMTYSRDFANVLAIEMILQERLILNGKEAMANPNAKLEVGPLEQMLNDSGAMAFTKAIAESDFVKGLLAGSGSKKYFNQDDLSGVNTAFGKYLKDEKNMAKFKMSITIPEKKARKEMAGPEVSNERVL